MTRIYVNEKIHISNKDVQLYKWNWKSPSILFYLKFQLALINSVKQK